MLCGERSRAIVLAAALAGIATGSHSQQLPPPPNFQARYIAVLSDADMRASTYIDQQLGQPRGTDKLSIVALPLDPSGKPTSHIEISNSVVGPVYGLAASKDGRTLFAVETRKQRAANAVKLADLEKGTLLHAIDITDPSQPQLLEHKEIGVEPKTISVHPDGDLLVIATEDRGKELVFVPFRDGRLGSPRAFPLRGLEANPEFFAQGLSAHHAQRHPGGRHVAVVIRDRGVVAFYQVARTADGHVADISLWANPVRVTKHPMSGAFSPDGKYFVTNDVLWGPDVHGFYLGAQTGVLSVVKLAEFDTPPEKARHLVVGGAATPRHPESIAFSHDGSLIATLNLGMNFVPQDHPYFEPNSSISLFSFDRVMGRLTPIGDWAFDGVLPEGIAFDSADQHLVVGVFEYPEGSQSQGALEFWKIERTPRIMLQRSAYRIATGPGPHTLIVVK